MVATTLNNFYLLPGPIAKKIYLDVGHGLEKHMARKQQTGQSQGFFMRFQLTEYHPYTLPALR